MRLVAHPADCPYQTGLDRNPANYAPLTPLSFIERGGDVYPRAHRLDPRRHARDLCGVPGRARKLAAALAGRASAWRHRRGHAAEHAADARGALRRAHGRGVLNSINIRLEPATIAYIRARRRQALLTDTEFAPTIKAALEQMQQRPLVIDVVDRQFRGATERLGELTYEELLTEGDESFDPLYPTDEWQAIGLNYTSGTTGQPKGVVVHHRGAYLAAMGQALANDMGLHPVYLWTLPMFHCNGWTFTWAVTLQAGTHVCLRRVEAGPSSPRSPSTR